MTSGTEISIPIYNEIPAADSKFEIRYFAPLYCGNEFIYSFNFQKKIEINKISEIYFRLFT